MAKKKDTASGASWIVRNLIFGALFVIIIVALVSIFLAIRTRHGKEVVVPDLVNLAVSDAASTASVAGLKTVVIDSVYMKRVARGAVVSQIPKAGSYVKPGRKISLTVNSKVPKKVAMPNLVHVSLRQAKAELQAKGLVLGKLNYVSDIATNNVLRQQMHGSDVRPGKEIYTGSTIDLVLGLNGADAMTYIPNLKGYKYLSAVDALHENSLNVSNLVFDKKIRSYSDSLAAVVYSQRPEATGYPTVMGTGVTLYLSLDADKKAN